MSLNGIVLRRAIQNVKSTKVPDKAGDKYALRRYYFDILISPLLKILFEWRWDVGARVLSSLILVSISREID